jgi:hypothetical protein
MRARMLAVMVTALVLVMTAPAFDGPREEAQARRELLAAQAAQAVKIRRAGAGFAKRIAIRVELWAEGEPNQISATVNTGDVNGITFVQTPETGGLNTDPNAFCLWFSNASYTIRWDDNTLTSGRFLTARGDWLNPVCMLTPLSDLKLR